MGDRLCSPSDEWMPPPPPPPFATKSAAGGCGAGGGAAMRLVQADDISYPRSENCPVHSPHRLRLASNGTPFRCVVSTVPRAAFLCHHHCHHHHHVHQPLRLCASTSQVGRWGVCPPPRLISAVDFSKSNLSNSNWEATSSRIQIGEDFELARCRFFPPLLSRLRTIYKPVRIAGM